MTLTQLLLISLLLLPVPVAVYLISYLVRKDTRIDLPLVIILGAGAIWSGGYAIELVASDVLVMTLASYFQYIALAFGPPGWFLLGLRLRGYDFHLPSLKALAVFAVPICTYLLVLTSELHELYWVEKTISDTYGFTVFSNTYGPAFWIHILYSYTMNTIGVVLIITTVLQSAAFYFWQRIAVISGLVLPWIANVLYVFRLTDLAIDLSPFALFLSSTTLYVSIVHLKLGELIPLTRARVISEMEDGLLVLNNQLVVLDSNLALQNLFGLDEASIGTDAAELLEAHPRLMRFLARQEEHSTELVYTGIQGKVLRVSHEFIDGDGDEASRLVVFRDVSRDSEVLNQLRFVLQGTSQYVGKDFYRALTRSLAQALSMRFALIGKLSPTLEDCVETLAVWDRDAHEKNFSYSLIGAPCENVTRNGLCVYPTSVADLFPDDKVLRERGMESYLGTPIHDHAGNLLGIMLLMDDKPLTDQESAVSLLETFASRAAAEIVREEVELRLDASETSYRRIEEHMQQSQKTESLGVLAGGVAHDFNNLLTPILGYVDLARARVSDQEADDYLGKIKWAAEKLAELCHQMLTYSGKGQFRKSPISLNERLQEFYELARATVPRSVQLDVQLGDSLPDINADPTQMDQVLLNLLINASEAIGEAPGTITVSTGLEEITELSEAIEFCGEVGRGDYVYFEVADDGPGISEKDRERLFEPFFSTKFAGRGLGMAVVYGILRAHDGAIRIRSHQGTGTEIRVYLPVYVKRSEDRPGKETTMTPAEPAETKVCTEESTLSRGEVLVVDDEEYVRGILRGMLQNMGFDAIEASDGHKGLEAFDEYGDRIVACIIDLTMPGMAGMELLSRIREVNSSVPVLLVSGYSRHEVREQEAKSPHLSFLQKPFTLEQFKTAMDAQLAATQD